MAIFKCKMCGGTIEFEEGASLGICDSCGTKQTLPRLDDERRANLYDRANHFRRNNDFDKAAGLYEQILNEDTSDAEAYWSLVLCKYGIEYVEDPATKKRVPTVNRAQYTSVFDDENYKEALKYADSLQKILYEEEAGAINEIQKGFLEISQREEPFDVFICYKETDANGRRTPDSVLANDLYHQLTQEGFKVFFSRITLEDKLGTAYEPYIFAALNSAKIMVVIGTKQEYFNAVWVKNEWSRFLNLVKNSGGNKVLIPAYRDMDPYDLPEEFAHLQAQDMSKLGFMQDLIRGIRKIAGSNELPGESMPVVEVRHSETGNSLALLKRGNLALEDGDWEGAASFFENALNQDAECSGAYLGKFLTLAKEKTLQAWVQQQKSVPLQKGKLLAGYEDRLHIEEAVKKAVPLFLTEAEIRDRYQFDFSFPSEQPCIKERLKSVEGYSFDRYLGKAIRFAQEKDRNFILGQIKELSAYWTERLKRAEAEDRKSMAEVMDKYKKHLLAADQAVEELVRAAVDALEQKYRQSIGAFEGAASIAEYRSVQQEFASYCGYKDSAYYINLCDERIRDEEKRILLQGQQIYGEAIRKMNAATERFADGEEFNRAEFNDCEEMLNSIIDFTGAGEWRTVNKHLWSICSGLSICINYYCGYISNRFDSDNVRWVDERMAKCKKKRERNGLQTEFYNILVIADDIENEIKLVSDKINHNCVEKLQRQVLEIKRFCTDTGMISAAIDCRYEPRFNRIPPNSFGEAENNHIKSYQTAQKRKQKAIEHLISIFPKSVFSVRTQFKQVIELLQKRYKETVKKQAKEKRDLIIVVIFHIIGIITFILGPILFYVISQDVGGAVFLSTIVFLIAARLLNDKRKKKMWAD